MTLTTRGEAVAVATALALGLGLGATAPHWNPYTARLDRATTCHTIDLPEDVDGTSSDDVSPLLAAGWFGDPTDHLERLYSPGCSARRRGESANQVR